MDSNGLYDDEEHFNTGEGKLLVRVQKKNRETHVNAFQALNECSSKLSTASNSTRPQLTELILYYIIWEDILSKVVPHILHPNHGILTTTV